MNKLFFKSSLCPVCGYQLSRPPEDEDICPSCGTQFGYSNSGRTYQQLRDAWLAWGAHWHSKVHAQPRNWSPTWQLIQAGFLNPKLIPEQSTPVAKTIDLNEYNKAPREFWNVVYT